MASAGRLSTQHHHGGADDPSGLVGAVVRAAGDSKPVRIDDPGFLLAPDLDMARTVLSRDADYTLPFDVTRSPIRRNRSPTVDGQGKELPPLSGKAVAHGREVLEAELGRINIPLDRHPVELDALSILREPVARSTTAAVLPDVDEEPRARIADLVLCWVDSLKPIIAARRAPSPLSAARRNERHARRRLFAALREAGCPEPGRIATGLAAGVQVPVAAGAWCLAVLAAQPGLQQELRTGEDLTLPFVWEILRLYPPTWLIARITTRSVTLGGTVVPAYTPVVVSPVALGRLPSNVPGPDEGYFPLEGVDLRRWTTGRGRPPGAWLPFGAGQHACPGRSLGLAQLSSVVQWAGGFELAGTGPLTIDVSRGLAPRPSTMRFQRAVPPRVSS